jgi:peptidoglycan hydrolase-like protein with peptidoglycan-binding domain
MRGRVGVCAVALGLTVAVGGATVEAAAAPAVGSHTATGKQCPVKEIKKVWYGGTSTMCPNLPDELDHLFYPGHQFTTALAHKYRERVVFIQLRLHDRGHRAIVVDGHYGKQTRTIVKRYQRKHGLVVDGKVGLQTWKSLFGLGRA